VNTPRILDNNMAAAVSTSNSASPIVHAMGGSIGSALALLLFYPLERARIELQSRVATQQAVHKASEQQEHLLNSVQVEVDFEPAQHAASIGTSEDDGDLISTSSSWSPVHRERSMTPDRSDLKRSGNTSPSSDPESNSGDVVGPDEAVIAHEPLQQRRRINSDVMQCLVDLHARGALYQGVTPVITTIFASQFVFFFLHAYVKGLMQQLPFFGGPKRGSVSSEAVLSLASSCIAGVGNVLLTNPLWVANMSIVTGEAKSESLIKELLHILRVRGCKHLWSGTAASILLVSNPVIQFFSYEQLKNARFAYGVRRHANVESTGTLAPLEAFVAGAIAKTVATVATYPLQLTQTILRLENHGYHGIVDCLIKLYRRAGYQEWYTGIRAKLLQTVLNASFTFLTYEQIVRAIQLALLRSSGLPEHTTP
jgi:adenine nucleotide transporter 17